MNDSLLKRFIVRFITRRAALMVGNVVPAGIGAVIGGRRATGRWQKTTIKTRAKPSAGRRWSGPRTGTSSSDATAHRDRPSKRIAHQAV